MGSMISKKHLSTVDGFIQGIDEGAKLLLEVSDKSQKGFYTKPTLFDNLKEDMTIAQEEIFGPVLGVLTTQMKKHLKLQIQNTVYARVFSQDIDKAFILQKTYVWNSIS